MFLWLAAALFALSAIGLASHKAWPVLYPETVERAPLTACDLGLSACSVDFESGGSLLLDIRPRGIPMLHPLQIQVQLQGQPAPQRVEVDFAGLDMDMGYNRVNLSSSDATGEYVGSGMLPICVRDRMTWEARVLLYRPDSILAAPFRFETAR